MEFMSKVSFVIGAMASGKTHFIKQFFADKDVDVLNIFDYQQNAYKESGFGEMMPIGVQFRCLMKANDMLLNDIIEKLKCGRDVVVEQTFLKQSVELFMLMRYVNLLMQKWKYMLCAQVMRDGRKILE